MLQTLIQRYKDYQHERKIKQLMRRYHDALFRCDIDKALDVWVAANKLIMGRSKEQVRRMEQEKGLCR